MLLFCYSVDRILEKSFTLSGPASFFLDLTEQDTDFVSHWGADNSLVRNYWVHAIYVSCKGVKNIMYFDSLS